MTRCGAGRRCPSRCPTSWASRDHDDARHRPRRPRPRRRLGAARRQRRELRRHRRAGRGRLGRRGRPARRDDQRPARPPAPSTVATVDAQAFDRARGRCAATTRRPTSRRWSSRPRRTSGPARCSRSFSRNGSRRPARRTPSTSTGPCAPPTPAPTCTCSASRWPDGIDLRRRRVLAGGAGQGRPGRRAITHPIAGSRPRGKTPEDDLRLAEDLLADPKERAEHVMLVDLGRNDLQRVCRPGTVDVVRVHERAALLPRHPPRVDRRR